MSSILKKIKKARTDITDYVIHWTRYHIDKEAEDKLDINPVISGNGKQRDHRLTKILGCGYLKPSCAVKPINVLRQVKGGGVMYDNEYKSTIKGGPAVCFTEQTLACLLQSCQAEPNRYSRYGIALKKSNLYRYGGRPAIYGDRELLLELPDEYRYLWVSYNPNRSPDPLDWTHEREWRCKSKDYLVYDKLILTADKGVPLVLTEGNPSNEKLVNPYIIVSKNEERERLKESILKFSPDGWQSEYLKIYFERLPHFKIISLEEVEEHLQAGENEWGRIETIPFEESDNSNESENH